MGLIKRPIGFLLEKLLPEVEGVPPHNILPKVPATHYYSPDTRLHHLLFFLSYLMTTTQVANDCAADILEDLHHLFNFAHQIFGELSTQAVDTATRIGTPPHSSLAFFRFQPKKLKQKKNSNKNNKITMNFWTQGNLRVRLENCEQYLPQAEGYIDSLEVNTFRNNPRVRVLCRVVCRVAWADLSLGGGAPAGDMELGDRPECAAGDAHVA
jgi:hypothetical protein